MEQAEPPGSAIPPADFRRRAIARALDVAVAALPLLLARRSRASVLVAAALVLCGDSLFGAGRSLGKRLAGLRVIKVATQRPANVRESMLRNAIFVLALVPPLAGAPLVFAAAAVTGISLLEISIALRPLTRDLGQRRFGDLLAGTQVVDGRTALRLSVPRLEARVEASAPFASRAARAAALPDPSAARPHTGAACASP